MLENWLRPVSKDFLENNPYKDFQLGSHIQIYKDEMPIMSSGQLAIIGLNEHTANAVRHQLYKLSFAFDNTIITDLGNARRTEPDFLLQLLTDLYSSKIIPILIGENPALSLTQYKAQRLQQSAISLSVIDSSIPYNTGDKEASWLDYVLDNTRSKLFNINILGIQTHFLPSAIIKSFYDRKFNLTRLGKIKSNIQNCEPMLRDTDTLAVNISALKYSEAPAQADASSSGLFCEEMCQLMRYAGMSEKMTAVGIYGLLADKDTDGVTAKSIAQMVWYFLNGFHLRCNDYPISTDNMSEYITDIRGYDWRFTFWKSNKTGRWWIQVPTSSRKHLKRHRLIPCTYEDYTQAVNGEISEHLLNAFERFA